MNAPGCNPNAVNPGQPSNYLKTQCFAYPALGTFGNLGRNTLRGPGLQDFDFSLLKTQSFGERLKLQFRAEAFNLLNHANFEVQLIPLFNNKGQLNSTAGVLNSPTVTTSRQIQFGLKLIL